jgi:hypothetical protein
MMSQVTHLVGRSGDQTRHRAKRSWARPFPREHELLAPLAEELLDSIPPRRRHERAHPLVEEDLAAGLIGKAPLVQHAKHGLLLGGAEPPWAALADGRSVGCLRLVVTAERGHSIYPPHVGLHAKGPTPDHEQLSWPTEPRGSCGTI